MTKDQIKVGGVYEARVGGRYGKVRVDRIQVDRGHFLKNKGEDRYHCTVLATGGKVEFRSAAKFRCEAADGSYPDPKQHEVPLEKNKTEVVEYSDHCTREEPDCVEGDLNGDGLCDGCGKPEGEQRADPTPATVTARSSPTATSAATIIIPSAPSTSGATANSVVPTSKLAARLAAMNAAPALPAGLTQQQADILATAQEIDAARGRGFAVVVIGAGAGTGKTYTLKKLEEVLRGVGQYTAFNTSLVKESAQKFKRAACNTTHSLAFRAVGRQFAHRLGGRRIRSHELARRLDIRDQYVKCGDPYPKESLDWWEAAENAGFSRDAPPPDDFEAQPTKRLKGSFLAGQVTEALRRFCQSADPEVGLRHFRAFPGLDKPGEWDNSEAMKEYLLPFARRLWADKCDPNGTLPFGHDDYVKMWELGRGKDRPIIAADYILLDEAQDTAPVMLSILQQQTHALLVLVGDDNQQIYEWRGAINAMASFEGAPRRLLSQSFRFGQVIADVANAVLGELAEPTDLVMTGLTSIPSRVCPVAEPRCYLYRTNAGAIGRLMAGQAEGKRGHLIGGSDEVVRFCRAALDLQAGRGTDHTELGCFATWAEVQEYSKEDEGRDLRLMVKLIDKFGAEGIITSLGDMPEEKDADFVTCTAHRSKGREWSSVKLGQDFPTKNKMEDSDCRLLYVALTRAQEELDITECPPFCGGNDTRDTGNPETSGAWVPGIEVEYTVPMPTEADLDAYRAGKRSDLVPADARAHEITVVLPMGVAAGSEVAKRMVEKAEVAAADEPPLNTWTKGRDGGWLVRGRKGQSGVITVTRKNGTTSNETIKGVIWSDDEVALYKV
jgi:hypothetical protein